MDRVLSTLLKMPGFIIEMFTEHLIVSVAGVMIFLLALIVPGRIGSLIRKVVILANVLFAMAGGFMGRLQNGYEIICLSAFSLIILLVVRMIVRISGAIKQRKIDARIEEKALAKAAKRRGAFKKRQGYSGESREIDDEDFVPPSEAHVEIRKVIENEINEGKAREEATIAAYESGQSGAAEATQDAFEDEDDFKDVNPFYYDDTFESDDALENDDSFENDDDFENDDNFENDDAPGSAAVDSKRKPEKGDEESGPSYIPLHNEKESYSAVMADDLPEGVFYVRPRLYSDQTAQKVLENDVHEALKRLSELRDNGILTDEEFEVKKAELLARIKK